MTLHCSIRHPNIISLIGWCHHGDSDRVIMLYEFMVSGSVRQLLDNRSMLPMDRRVHILLGEIELCTINCLRVRVGIGDMYA